MVLLPIIILIFVLLFLVVIGEISINKTIQKPKMSIKEEEEYELLKFDSVSEKYIIK
jgi:hypothetical protein